MLSQSLLFSTNSPKARPWRATGFKKALVHSRYLKTWCWNPYGYHKDTQETTAFVLFNSVGLKGLCVWQKKNMETRQLKRAVFLFWSFCSARRKRKRPPVSLVSSPPRLEFPVLNVLLFQSLCPSPPSLISACSLSFPVVSCFHLWHKEKVWEKREKNGGMKMRKAKRLAPQR